MDHFVITAPSGQFVTVDKFVEGYALITICKEPVNSMNRELWQQLGDALTACEKDRGVRGVVLASGLKKDIFTAGNDITELYAPKTSEENFRAFWTAQVPPPRPVPWPAGAAAPHAFEAARANGCRRPALRGCTGRRW